MLDLENLDNPPLDGAALITKERHRQKIDLGYDASDAGYTDGCLAMAAASYLYLQFPIQEEYEACRQFAIRNWPWADEYLKLDGTRIRELTKAGALIAAELDRLLKLEQDEQPESLS